MSSGVRVTYKGIGNKNYKEENIERIGDTIPETLPDIKIRRMKKP